MITQHGLHEVAERLEDLLIDQQELNQNEVLERCIYLAEQLVEQACHLELEMS